jgi:1-deoxy-D-xylulose-5-phosphate reductoisomerase
LEVVSPSNPDSLNALLALDAQARSVAEQAAGRFSA